MIILEIDGAPIPQPRHRSVKRGSFVHTYDPAQKEKQLCKWQIKTQFNQSVLSCPILMDILYHMPIPKSTSKKMRTSMLHGVCHHIKRPDCDNLAKFTLDVLNEIVFEDDSQVIDLRLRKIYSAQPKTIIYIKTITDYVSENCA